jgi:hypothetical protein
MTSRIILELAEQILARERLYDAAFESDLAVLTKRHGEGAVQEALALLDAREADDEAPAVRRGIIRP